MTFRIRATVVALAAAVPFTAPVLAEDKPEFVRILRPVIFNAQRENRADAHRVDDWTMRGFLRTQAEAVDNVFAVPVGEEDEVIILARPAFEIARDGEVWDFEADGFLQQQYFTDGTNDSVTEGGANAGAAVNFSDTHRLSTDVGYLRNVQERTDPEETGGQQPEEDRTYARVTHYIEGGRMSLRTIVEARHFDFLDNIDDDRDRVEHFGSVRLRYAASDSFTPYLGVDYTRINFQDAVDDFGFDRDGERLSARIGFLYRTSDTFYVQAAVGSVRHTFDEAAFRDFDSVLFEADAVWTIDERTSIVLDAGQSENVTTLFNASTRVRRFADLRVEHFVADDVALFASAGVRRDDFENTAREDDFTVAAVGIEWLPAKGVNVFADYRYTERESTDPTESYELNAVRLGARFSF
jgi:hypothetical protein